jgi:hypothetical protein
MIMARQTFDGFSFEVKIERDDDMGAPWEEHDGHGIVSEWTSREAEPGERVLVSDNYGGSRRYYDIDASIDKALAEGWDAEPYHAAFPNESPRAQAARAVEADYKYLRAWCMDEWQWTMVGVQLIDPITGKPSNFRASLGGIDGNDPKYIDENLPDLFEEAIAEYRAAPKCECCKQVLPVTK